MPKGRSFTANSGTKAAVLPKGRPSTANSDSRVAVLLGMNRCGSFPLLSTPQSLFKISEKIPEPPMRRWGEWIWLTEPSGLQRNSTQGLNISSIRVFHQIRDAEIPITNRSPYSTTGIFLKLKQWMLLQRLRSQYFWELLYMFEPVSLTTWTENYLLLCCKLRNTRVCGDRMARNLARRSCVSILCGRASLPPNFLPHLYIHSLLCTILAISGSFNLFFHTVFVLTGLENVEELINTGWRS